MLPPPVHTPQLPPFRAQCLQEEQVVQAEQSLPPVCLPKNASNEKDKKRISNKQNIFFININNSYQCLPYQKD